MARPYINSKWMSHSVLVQRESDKTGVGFKVENWLLYSDLFALAKASFSYRILVISLSPILIKALYIQPKLKSFAVL